MPKIKKISADAYELIFLDDKKDFVEHVLKPVLALPIKVTPGRSSRWLDLDPGWLCIDHLKRTPGAHPRWEGNMLRVFNDELPNKASPRGTADLDIDDDEGLGEHIAFLYDETSKLLWLQRDRRVCGKLLFLDYLAAKSNTSVGATVRLRKDAIERAMKLKHIRGVEFGYLNEAHKIARGRKGIAAKLGGLSTYGAARVLVSLKPVRGGTLDPSAKELVRDIADAIDDDLISKAHVSGLYEADDERDTVIDLLRDRARMSTSIAADRKRDPVRLRGAVTSIWSEHRAKV